MKKIFAALLAVLMILSVSACSKKAEQESFEPEESVPAEETLPPDPTTPDGAAEILLDNISSLKGEDIDAAIQEVFPSAQLPQAATELLKPITERMTYTVGNSKVDGDTAMVDVSITAVDAKSALNSVLAGAAAYTALQRAGGNTENPEDLFARYIAEHVDWDKAATIKTDATVHLVKGGDGEWKLDTGNPDNLQLANALSGGAVDLLTDISSMIP